MDGQGQDDFERYKDEFAKCTTYLQRVNFIIDQVGTHVPESRDSFRKGDQKAEVLRLIGNAHFRHKEYIQAVEAYTGSLAAAETNRVAAYALSNRSAALFMLGLYQQCKDDVHRALKHNCPRSMRVKLKARRRCCRRKLQALAASQPESNQDDEEVPDCIEFQTDDATYGRHMVAKRDIEIGEVLHIERPIASCITKPEDLLIHCNNCTSLCYNPIPCDSCARVVFCCKMCKRRARRTYHKYACRLLEPSVVWKLAFMSIFELKENEGVSGLLEALQTLTTYVDKCPLKTLFCVATLAANVYSLLKTKSSMFEDFAGMDDTFKEVLPFVFHVVRANGLEVGRMQISLDLNQTVEYYAQALYMRHSAFNHSCYPNALHYQDRLKIVVRASGTIKRGEQIFLSYHQTYDKVSRDQRQAYLKQTFYFTCTCVACEGGWPTERDDISSLRLLSVKIAQRWNNQAALKRLLQEFIQELKRLEANPPPVRRVMGLKELIQQCYQVHINPRTFRRV